MIVSILRVVISVGTLAPFCIRGRWMAECSKTLKSVAVISTFNVECRMNLIYHTLMAIVKFSDTLALSFLSLIVFTLY